MLAAWFLVACRTDPAVEAERFFATRPIYERPLDRGTMPAGLTDLSAASCGACHPDAYAEWQVSTHAHAWVDRQFQAEITKSENRWMCQNCHTPLMIQQAQWPVSLVNDDVERPVWVQNPDVSSALQQEGISCASCHVKDGMIVGPNGTQNAAHPTREDASFRGVEVCLRCHQATATYPGKSFVCTFQTGDEWAAGPYGAVNQPCQTCHMPTVVRPIVAGGEPVEAHRHWWAGGGIPKVAGVYPPESALPPGLLVQVIPEGGELRVLLINAFAGHMLPSGDPERFYEVVLTFDNGVEWRERIGQVWQWSPEPKKLSDNRIPPAESREERVQIPPGALGAELVVSRHRMTPENAAYHNLDGYPISDEVDRQSVTWEAQPGSALTVPRGTPQ